MTISEYLDAHYYTDTTSHAGVRERTHKSQKMMRSSFSLLLDHKIGEIGPADIAEWRAIYGQAVMSEDGHRVIKFAVKDVTKKENLRFLRQFLRMLLLADTYQKIR